MELGGVLRARRAPATGGKAAAQGATRCDRQSHLATGRGGQSLLSHRGENSPREEPPAGGSTRLGEKRETRGELREVLASPVAAHAPTASPRLRRRRRPPRGPAPEVRLRQFRCPG